MLVRRRLGRFVVALPARALVGALLAAVALSAASAASGHLTAGVAPRPVVRHLATNNNDPLPFNTPTTVTVSNPGDVATLTFTATAGQRISMTSSGMTMNSGTLGVYQGSSQSNPVAETTWSFSSNLFLDKTGPLASDTYTVRVSGSVGSFSLTLYDVVDVNGSLTLGSGMSLNISTPGQDATYSFSAPAGSHVTYTSSGNTINNGSVTIFEGGNPLNSTTWSFGGNAFIDQTYLQNGGTYTVTINPGGASTGQATITVWSVVDASGSLTLGSGATLNITAPGQNATYTFTATAGQHVSLAATGNTINNGSVTIVQGGSTVASTTWSFGAQFFVDQTGALSGGTYTVSIDPGGASMGQATVTLYSVSDYAGTIASGGSGVPLTLATPGQDARLSFSGTKGQPVQVAMTAVTVEAGTISLEGPNGTEASQDWRFHSATTLTATLGASGTYKIHVGPWDANTGQATIALNPSAAYEPPEQTYGPGDGGLDALNQSGSWDDVNTLLGAYTTQATDASMPDTGIPFNYTRSYTSASAASGRLGPGWSDSYSAAIAFQSNGDALVQDENGQQVYFAKQADGSFIPPQGGLASLTAVGGNYQLLNNDQTKLSFSSAGRLISIKDRNNEGVTLAYDGGGNLQSVTDSVNRVVTFTPNPDGTLQKLTLPDGRHVDFGYTGGHLTSVADMRGGVTQYGYDASGLLATVQNQNLHTVVTNHYTNSRLDTQTDALGKQTFFAWDAGTQTETITDPNGHAWKHVYQNNMLVQSIDPLGNTTTYGYDAKNNLTSVRDPRLNTTAMTYDSRHNMLSRTAPSPFSYLETWTYNSFNDPLTYVDGRGNVTGCNCASAHTTSYGYDTAGNLTSKTLPDPDGAGALQAPVIQYGRDPAGTGLLFSQTDPNNRTTAYGYDTQANLTSITTPLSEKTTMGYDTVGRMTSRVDGRGNVTGCGCAASHTTTFGYDNADHLTSETDPGLPAKTWLYDPAGNLQKITDQNAHYTTYGYDADERLSSVIAPDTTSITSYDYDNAGNLAHRTDPNNHVTTYGYDNANRLTTLTLPALTSPSAFTPVWTYGYDAAGNRTTSLDPNGATTTTTYDELNRSTQVSYSGGATTPTVTYTYDPDSNRATMVDGDGTVTDGYDNDNRLTSSSRAHSGGGADAFAYEYDAAGNVTKRTYPDGTVATYAPDNDGRLSSVTVGTAVTSYGYDPAGNLTTATLPSGNGYVETRSYDNANRLTEVKNAKGASVLSDFVQTLDNVGNALTVTRSGASSSTRVYGYDSRDRLTSACLQAACPNSFDPKLSWTYDGVGNRLTETRTLPTANTTATSTYNEGDELIQTVTQSSSPYATQVEADGAQPFWRLGETSGASFASSIGTFNGTWTASPTLGVTGALNGDSNKAVTLTAASHQFGTAANAAGLNKTNNFTIELWIKRSVNATSQPVLGKPLTTTTKSENYAIWLDTANKVRFEVGNGTTSKTVTTATAVDTNWHHVAATFASGALKIYLDGSLSASATATFTTAGTNTGTFDIGHFNTSYFGGSLDEIAIYGTALSATQISDHRSKGVTAPPGNQTVAYAYDHNGNQTGAGGRTFSYDVSDRLTATTNGGVTDSYVYDGDDNRLSDTVGSTVTRYLWDSNGALSELALERDGSNNLVRRYVYGAGIGPLSMATSAGDFYYHNDTQRNVANVTNATGATQWTYSYEPFGLATATATGSPPANPIQFNGQYLDSTGLYNLRARMYDAATGRFDALDPAPAGPSSPYESSYVYASDDPVNGYDVAGTWPSFGRIVHAVVSNPIVQGAAEVVAIGVVCGATAGVGCAVAVGAGVGVGLGVAGTATAKGHHSLRDYATSGAIGGAEGAVVGVGVGTGYLGGGRDVRLPGKARVGTGKWFGGAGRKWQARIPHYHRGSTNKLRDFHRPWEKGF